VTGICYKIFILSFLIFVATDHIEGIQNVTFCVKLVYVYFSADYFVLRSC